MTITSTLSLSRAQHDMVLRTSPATLQRAFAECKARKWSLQGVEFTGLPADLAGSLEALRGGK